MHAFIVIKMTFKAAETIEDDEICYFFFILNNLTSGTSGNQLFLMTPVCLLGVLLHKKRSFHIFSSVEVYTCFYMMLIRFKNLSDTKDSKKLYRILGKIGK